MFPLASFLLSLVGLLVASYTDLRDRTIPNTIPLFLALAGMGLAAYESWSMQSFLPLVWGGGVMLSTYIVAYLFWKAGAWAGGDVKLFTGLAALNPFNPFWIASAFPFSFFLVGREWIVPSFLPVFMLNLFMVSVLMLIPYTALLSIQALSHVPLRKEFVHITGVSLFSAIEYGLLLVLFSFVFNYFSLPIWGSVIPLLFVSFFPGWIRIILSLVSLFFVFLQAISLSSALLVLVLLMPVNLLRNWYGFAQRHVLTKTKRISDLVDGDIAGERIVKRGEKVVREPPLSFKTIIKAGMQRNRTMILSLFHPSGEILADPRRAAGVYPHDIVRLKAEVKAGRLSDEIKVKASSPFAPAVLLAYVFLNAVGDGPLAWVGG
jgi:preflagellin peptidase FlaK